MASEEEAPKRPMASWDVVLLKAGKGDHNAEPGDFKRVTVQAADSLGAQLHDDVATAAKEGDGFNVLFATPPGHMTEPEIAAAQRAHTKGFVVDRVNL